MFKQEEQLQSPRQGQPDLSNNATRKEKKQMQMELILITPNSSQDQHSIEVAPTVSQIAPHLHHSPVNALCERMREKHDDLCVLPLHYDLQGHQQFSPQSIKAYRESPCSLRRTYPRNSPNCCLSEGQDDTHSDAPLDYIYIHVPHETTNPKTNISKSSLPPPPPSSFSPTSGQAWPFIPIMNNSKNPVPPLLPCFRYNGHEYSSTAPIRPFKMTTIDNAWKASEMAQSSLNNSIHGSESMIFSSGDDSEEEDNEYLDGVKFLNADI